MVALDVKVGHHHARRFVSRVPGLQYDLHEGVKRPDFTDQLLARHSGHEVIDKKEVNVMFLEDGEGALARFCGENPVTLAFQETAHRYERLLVPCQYHPENECPPILGRPFAVSVSGLLVPSPRSDTSRKPMPVSACSIYGPCRAGVSTNLRVAKIVKRYQFCAVCPIL